ncbi:Strigolactone esterase D14 [Linum grandiflorum]
MVMQTTLKEAMNARTTGSSNSETMVLAHGYGGDQSAWDDIVPELTPHCQVVTFDWCFSGAIKDSNCSLFDEEKYATYEAYAEDLIKLMEEMEVESVVFLGHSMSGMIGCIASIKRPDLFKRLVLVGASPRYMNAEEYEGGFERTHIEDLITNIETNFSNWAPAFASMVVGSGGDDPSAVDKFANSLLRMKPEVALSVAKTVFYGDYRGVLAKVTTPTTIVQTTHDAAVPTSVAYYMQERIKGKSTVEIVETDGHFPHLTARDQLLDLLRGVLGFAA